MKGTIIGLPLRQVSLRPNFKQSATVSCWACFRITTASDLGRNLVEVNAKGAVVFAGFMIPDNAFLTPLAKLSRPDNLMESLIYMCIFKNISWVKPPMVSREH